MVFCLLRQAERSIDHALLDDWNALRHYYAGRRSEQVREAAQYLLGLPKPPVESDRDRIRKVIDKRLWSWQCLLTFPKFLLDRERESYVFAPDELFFMAGSLAQLLTLLSLAQRPSNEDIVELRTDLIRCQSIIKRRCRNLAAFKKAERIENFGMPPFFQHFTIEEIVPDASM